MLTVQIQHQENSRKSIGESTEIFLSHDYYD